MKNIRVRILSLIIVMLVALSGINMVKAATSIVTLTSDSKLKAGDTVTISVNMASGYEGIQGKLNYDTNVFESASMEKAGTWNANLSNGIAVIDRETAASGTETAATLTLKVKDNISVTSTTIKLENVKGTQNGGSVTGDTATITLSVDSNPNSGSETGKTNTPATTNTPAKTTNTKITSSKTTSKKLPKAGDVASIVVISSVAVVAVVAIISFVRYQKNKDIK